MSWVRTTGTDTLATPVLATSKPAVPSVQTTNGLRGSRTTTATAAARGRGQELSFELRKLRLELSCGKRETRIYMKRGNMKPTEMERRCFILLSPCHLTRWSAAHPRRTPLP